MNATLLKNALVTAVVVAVIFRVPQVRTIVVGA